MSLSAQEARSFFGPLKGRTATFILESREVNLPFARSLVSLAAFEVKGCAVFDIDAFYSSNSEEVLAVLPPGAARSTLVYVPEPGSNIETELPRLFRAASGVFIIDSLNTLYHLFSSSGASSKSRKLAFAIAGLSYLARTSEKAVLFTMYRRERAMKTGGGRPISGLSDLTVSVEAGDSELQMKCERGKAWHGGRFSLRIT